MADKGKLMSELQRCIVDFDVEGIRDVAEKVIEAGMQYGEVIRGISAGMEVVGQRYENRDFFLPELIMAGETAKVGMEIFKSHLRMEEEKGSVVVLGTVQGDLHDIGKNIAAALLASAGFTVYDLGIDVSAEKFVDKAKEFNADIVGMSALITSTMPYMKVVMDEFVNAGVRDRVKVIVGGAPLSEEYAKKIGADAYAKDAVAAVKICKKWREETN